MIVPLKVSEIGEFIQMSLFAFDSYIYVAFILMAGFAIALGVRNLLTWGN